MGFYNIKVRRIMADVYIINKKEGVKMNTLSFLHKAPTFSSQGFAVS